MGLTQKHVVSVVAQDPDRAWQLSELIEKLGGLCTDAEAVQRYRLVQGLTEDTDPDDRPLARKIRHGRRHLVSQAVSTAAEQGTIIKAGPRRGPDVRYSLNKDHRLCRIAMQDPDVFMRLKKTRGKVSEIGYHIVDIEAFILRQNGNVTLRDVVDAFIDQLDHKLLRKRKEHAGYIDGNRTKVYASAVRVLTPPVEAICEAHGWEFQRPLPEDARVIKTETS